MRDAGWLCPAVCGRWSGSVLAFNPSGVSIKPASEDTRKRCRREAHGGTELGSGQTTRHPTDRQDEIQCHFCEGYLQAGGCGGFIEKVNHAILREEWEEARRATDEFITTVRGLELARKTCAK